MLSNSSHVTPTASGASYHFRSRRNSDSESNSALSRLQKNYEERQRSGPYLHQAVGTIFGSSVASKSTGTISMSDPDRVSLHSSRSSIVANQAALSMAAPANTSKLNNSAIDPAAILLQQQLASGAPTGGAPPGGYTGGALGAPAGGAESGALAPVPAQPRPPEFQLFKEAEHNNELLAGLNDLRQENFLCDVTLMADDKPFQVLIETGLCFLTLKQ